MRRRLSSNYFLFFVVLLSFAVPEVEISIPQLSSRLILMVVFRGLLVSFIDSFRLSTLVGYAFAFLKLKMILHSIAFIVSDYVVST